MTDPPGRLEWSLSRGKAVLDVEQGLLRFVDSRGQECFQFKLRPFIEYKDAPSRPGPLTLEGCRDGHAVLASQDGPCKLAIHVQARGGFIDYWVVAEPLDGSSAPSVRNVFYGQDGPDLSADGSAHRLEEFYHLCPDRYGSLIPRTEPIRFRLGVLSFRFDMAWNFAHDSGRTIIPPYVAALRSGGDWLGVGTLEIPSSEYGLSMSFRDGRTGIDFAYGGNLRLKGPYALPRITVFDESDKVAVVKKYIRRLYDDGLAVHNRQWEDAWAGPIYCFFSDQMYEYQVDRSTPEMLGEMTMTANYCNERFMQQCLDFLVEKAIDYRMLILDYGWFICNGHWREHPERFSNLKAAIQKLQRMGKKVLLWYSPYFNAEQSLNYRQHPEIAVRKPDGSPLTVTRFSIEVNYTSDFTHPAMRELAMRDIEYMLGPDGLDADGIKLDCTHQPPTVENIFHDPSWGLGERFCYQVHKLVYDHAKKVKPSCCINTTSGNPLFNRTYDLHRIHDGLEYNLHGYEERAWAAWLCEAGISDLDDWPSYDLYTTRANLRKIVYGSPSLYAARHRGGVRKLRSSYGYSKTPTDDELALLSSLYELVGLAPVSPDQDFLIDPFAKVFERRYGSGPLKGFYAAKTLSGHQAVVVYTPGKAYLVSLADVAVAAPLPGGARDVSVQLMPRGTDPPRPVPAEVVGADVIFVARRCGRQVRRFEIGYRLQGP